MERCHAIGFQGGKQELAYLVSTFPLVQKMCLTPE